jgi:RNA polymerase sigma factor (sigma-70 family)
MNSVAAVFATTHWSVVLAAGQRANTQASEALEQLCRTYWYPLYAYVRHRGKSPEDSQDLTQEFFHRLLRKDYLSQVDPRKGKFRSFLLAAMNHFLANEWDRRNTLKRGGGITFVPLDELQAEQRYLAEQLGARSPEQLFERAWAFAVLRKILDRLRAETATADQAERFEALRPVLIGERPSVTYAALAAQLGVTEPALKMTVQRLRRRYAKLLREEIAQTVANDNEVAEELDHLRLVLSSA